LTLSLSVLTPAFAASSTVTVDVSKPGAPVSPMLWGIFFEDINCSADGGIYPELVRNRSFEDAEKPVHWQLFDSSDAKSELAIESGTPLNPYNRRHLRLRLNGPATLVNEGFWGMSVVQGETYEFRVAARAADGFAGPLTVLVQTTNSAALATGTVAQLTDRWQWYTLPLTASATDPKARLALRTEAKGTLWLDMISLMPKKTWKDHGLRPDLGEMLAGLQPSFVRFPGGCWVEGNDLAHSYRWKETVGDIAHRKPLYNIWQYYATHGLGYHEYLQMCEDLGAEILFVINCGMSHTEVVPMDQMGPLIQDALDAIEYANGPATSVWGGLRARNGHPAPFNLRYLEIGNENGGPAYHERYAIMYKAVKARYPELHIVANEWGGVPKESPVEIVDEHYYSNPEFFMQQADRYDRYDRKGPKVYVGEYAVTQGCGQGNLRAAVGEAAFMTGMERNSDHVIMSSYAPLFANVNYKKWNPDLINFDSARVYGLPSYYVQQMFSVHRGDVVLPITVEAPVTQDEPKGGAVGVGTWATQAEFKDLKVTRGNEVLFQSDFASGTTGWKWLGGDWKVQDGALRQTARTENIRALIGDKTWTDYTYTLKARKLGGAEGFLILFRVQDENEKAWWNIGGWGNQRHAIELGGVISEGVTGQIETGRWYDIRIELKGNSVKCYLDGKLIHDAKAPVVKTLFASATRVQANGEVILKLVNTAAGEQTADVQLNGASRVTGPVKAIILTSADPQDENTLEQPAKVAPVTRTVTLPGPGFPQSLPGNSVTVLRIPVN
jgi:alpha-L-arabinofuranosidase